MLYDFFVIVIIIEHSDNWFVENTDEKAVLVKGGHFPLHENYCW